MEQTQVVYETFARLGLGRSQARLYLEFLKTGSSNIAEMARSLNTSRQAIYLLLPGLLERGLVKEVRQAKRAHYQALPPSQLFGLLEDLKVRLDSVVPLLTNLQEVPAEVPLVTIYDSPLSMREWYRYFLENVEVGEEFYLYSSGNLDNWYKLDPKFYQNYMEQQVKKKIKLHCLLPTNKKAEEFKQEIGWSVSEYRYTHHALSQNVEQWIWRDQVCYQTLQGRKTNMIVIQSETLASFSKKQFLELWGSAQKV